MGLGGFEVAYKQVSHNTFLEIFINGGILAILIYGAFLTKVYLELKSTVKVADLRVRCLFKGITASFWGTCVMYSTVSAVGGLSMSLLLAAGGVLVAVVIPNKNRKIDRSINSLNNLTTGRK